MPGLTRYPLTNAVSYEEIASVPSQGQLKINLYFNQTINSLVIKSLMLSFRFASPEAMGSIRGVRLKVF